MQLMIQIKQLINRLKIKYEKYIFSTYEFGELGKNYKVGIECTVRNEENIFIGNNFSLGSFSCLQTWPEYDGQKTGFTPMLNIGNDVAIMEHCLISCMNQINIGNGVLLGDNVFITDNYHGDTSDVEIDLPPLKRKLVTKGEVIIGDNVWIGRNVCIMSGVTIGDGAIIAANAVVTKNIPPKVLAAGVPARIIKEL